MSHDDTIRRIEAALEAGPTPGPWEYREVEGMGAITHPHGWVEAVNSSGEQECTDARFIAACNPIAIRTLLDRLTDADRRAGYWKAEHLAGNAEIERLSAEIERLRGAV